ncbi:MAG: hypothetical protein KBB55_01270 [Candidatus Buchananbacteria bacterium]|nr:hypothetical protein [Candidatus Buchananbacteria bacterium]
MAYIFLISAFVLNALANLMLKLGARSGIDLASWSPLYLVAHNWQFIVGCILFVGNVPLYFLALKYLPLSIAYPIMVIGSFIVVNVIAAVALKEAINPWQIGGYALMIAGVLIVIFAKS